MKNISQLFYTFGAALLLTGVVISSVPSTAEATARRGTIGNRGRYSVRANGCLLKYLPTSTDSSARIRCDRQSGTASTKRNTPGVTFLRFRDSIIITARSCVIRKTRSTTKQIDITCGITPTSTPTITDTATVTPTPTATLTPTVNANALLTSNQLVAFNTDNPTAASAAVTVTGLTAGESLVAIDRRPQNGRLYGLGYNATSKTVQLYAISNNGVATAIGTTGTFVQSDGTTPILIGNGAATQFDIDFNPTVDRLRVITSNNGSGVSQNFRMNPNTGAFIDGDFGGVSGSITGLNPDGNANGNTTTLQGAAYTNNEANSTVTTLYTLDAGTDALCIQTPPNVGTQVCSTLPLGVDAVLGFDIQPGINAITSNTAVTGSGVVVVRTGGNSNERIAHINLADGTLTDASAVGANLSGILGIAIQQPAGTAMIGLSSSGTTLTRFNSATPGTLTSATVTSINAGETLVGIDYRPSTGGLYGIGVNATANTATLYLIDPQTAVGTAIGAPGSIAFVDNLGSAVDLPDTSVAGYGFDFNPTVDRVRVVTSTGLNFRVNPDTGAPVDGDLLATGIQTDIAQNGATTSVSSASYTNSSAGQTVTTLYTLDATTDALYIQEPANNGTQGSGIGIKLNGATLNFTDVSGFDIPSTVKTTTSGTAVTSGSGFAALTVSGTTRLYSINLVTGEAQDLGLIGTGSTSLAGLTVAQATATN